MAFSLLRAVPEGSWRWRGGVPVTDGWEVPSLVSCEDTEATFIPVDCLTMNTGTDGLILSEFARSTLGPLLSAAGEFWPVRVFERSYWWFNCLACVEALDRAGTDAEWGLVDGEWGTFRWITATRRLAFLPAKLEGAPAMYRVPEYPQGALFCSDTLVEAVGAGGLTGFQFDMLWSTEGGGVADPPVLGMADLFDDPDPASVVVARAEAVRVLSGRRRFAADRGR